MSPGVRRSAEAILLLAALALPGAPSLAGPSLTQLVEVADITGVSASPSGRQAVFRVERASIDSNGYSLEWYRVDLTTGAVRPIAGGGTAIEGVAEPLAVETAVWSPDERYVFYRARIDGAIGLWRAASDGSGSRPVVIADADIESVGPGADGHSLTYTLGPTRDAIARAEQREYDDGILVDGSVDLSQNLFRGGWVNGRLATQRMTGKWVARAGLLWQAPRQAYRLDLATLASSPLEPLKIPAVAPLTPVTGTTVTLQVAGRPPARVRRTGGTSAIEVDAPEGALTCPAAACRNAHVAAIAWRPGTEQIAFTTQDAHFRQALHLWDTRRGDVRLVVRAGGLLSGSRDPARPCALTQQVALCVVAGAIAPPQLESIDLSSGTRHVLFDPNRLLRLETTARAEPLTWTLADGRQATGTLLWPGSAGRMTPLFVSYYYCPGYLRGGIGDEFPFAPLVDAGIAVACLNTVPGEANDVVADYRAALLSVERLVDVLGARGRIDRHRVGMGGFSAGSEATMYVAMNSQLLAAAAIASPQYSPAAYWSDALPGRDYAGVLRAFLGLGSPEETPARWRLVSPALNTERITAPLLMQMPENEAREEAEIFTRLAQGPTPVELYAFPDESHVKVQPRHRLAVYRRNLDWFRYWLQDYRDPDPAKAAQYGRWDSMRGARG